MYIYARVNIIISLPNEPAYKANGLYITLCANEPTMVYMCVCMSVCVCVNACVCKNISKSECSIYIYICMYAYNYVNECITSILNDTTLSLHHLL